MRSFLGRALDRAGQPTTLVTYQNDPREDLAILSSPSAVIIDGVRVRRRLHLHAPDNAEPVSADRAWTKYRVDP